MQVLVESDSSGQDTKLQDYQSIIVKTCGAVTRVET